MACGCSLTKFLHDASLDSNAWNNNIRKTIQLMKIVWLPGVYNTKIMSWFISFRKKQQPYVPFVYLNNLTFQPFLCLGWGAASKLKKIGWSEGGWRYKLVFHINSLCFVFMRVALNKSIVLMFHDRIPSYKLTLVERVQDKCSHCQATHGSSLSPLPLLIHA